ncbi:venom allergen 5-like [Nilaparvata lugens]|uniref:venom allergen 5-like n=1 Tax=Nilaparvata lugens TaxID=108931 RepID=UPI00193D5801|nr:venom allergen 5-like [Nilaparvata lugens]
MVSIYSYCLIYVSLIGYLASVTHACTNGEINDNTVTEKDISDVIQAHNDYRATVALRQLDDQPPAQNMQEMTWDNKLAERAQYWADQCNFKHDENREKKTGQNLYIIYYGGSHAERQHNFTAAIKSWYDENQYYKYKKLQKGDSRDPRTQTGHYTQVVWANTNKVGCGFASYYHTGKKQDQILYVCNYAPAGNYEGEYPYIKGEPNCEGNGMSNSDIDGLCKK